MWTEVIAAHDRDLKRHFEIEESILLPALESIGAQALVDRTREDHARVRGCLADTGTEVTGRLMSFAGLIRKHVRFEEEELFEAAQENIPGKVLDEISEASRRE
ncbi:MAG: hemerythrin domain-containing protein [Acidobacteria bacterium]|nr:hemerythrin domain-containing protein [Acidobacteriota bacterium]